MARLSMNPRSSGKRALLSFCASAAIGWALSATALGDPIAPPTSAAGETGPREIPRAPAVLPVCGLGRPCTGTAGCAGECDAETSLIAGCARCQKGVYAGCSQGECQAVMELPAAKGDEAVCPNQLMTSCPKVGDMCTIGRTSHRCQCSAVGALQHPKWICK